MKAIVANVLFGSILGCFCWADSASAQFQYEDLAQLESSKSPILLSSNKLPIVPHIINLVDRIFTVNQSKPLNFSIDREAQIVFRDRFSLNVWDKQDLALDKLPYTHQNDQADVILGFQKTFWRSDRQDKYWGVTTVEHWGDNNQPKYQLNLAKLNYTNLSPALPSGRSTLTFSGGGDQNLAQETDISREFQKFRGGVSYHHGLVDSVTVGTGFIYEDFLIGFTQLTYNSDRFPLKTTVSLLAQESRLDFRSHVRFQPDESFVLNYYHDENKNKFDANWQILSGLTLTADGDSEKQSLNTGIKVAIHSDYMSISAKAVLDRNNQLQWKLKSRIGGLKFVHGNDSKKYSSNVDLSLVDTQKFGFQCSAFVQYESKIRSSEENFTVWGSKFQSVAKITPDKHLWSINLGYGTSVHGGGLIASSSFTLNPNLSLKLSYQEISATSDDTKIKLQIGSP